MLSSVLIAGFVAMSSVSARVLPPRAAAFGSCGSPAIIFATGLDGRTEAAFEPANLGDFNHGSADGIGIITSFICQQLNDKCRASADQIAACQAGATAAAALTGQAAADAFNAALGVTATSTSTPATTTSAAVPASTAAASSTTAVVATTTPASTGSTTSAVTNTGTLSFGKCTDPTVIFGAGLDNRKPTEFSFLPNDLTQFNHNSALNPDIIFQFMCDNLVNSCGLTRTDTAVTACESARTTADAVGRTGATADKFNELLGFTTNFAALDSQLPSSAAPPAAPTTTTAAVLAAGTPSATDSVCSAATTTVMVTVTAAPAVATATTTDAAAPTTTAATTASTGASAVVNTGPLTFGTCTDPTVIFAAGLEGRKPTEFSFLPHNLQEFNHNTALNPDIIYQFTCDNMVNNCGLKQTDAAVVACRSAQQTADAVGRTGASADKFNGLLGFVTNFAALDSQLTSTTTGKRNVPVMKRSSRDPRLALKEATEDARRRGVSVARNVRVPDWA